MKNDKFLTVFAVFDDETQEYLKSLQDKILENNLEVVYSFERDKKWFNTDCTTMVVRAETKEKWLERQACEEKE